MSNDPQPGTPEWVALFKRAPKVPATTAVKQKPGWYMNPNTIEWMADMEWLSDLVKMTITGHHRVQYDSPYCKYCEKLLFDKNPAEGGALIIDMKEYCIESPYHPTYGSLTAGAD